MRLLAFSDLHTDLVQAQRLAERSDEADVVVGVGDFASVHSGLAETIEALRGDRGAGRARPGQQRNRGRSARGVRGLGAGRGPARRGHGDRRRRLLRPRRGRPCDSLGLELRPHRGGGQRRCSRHVPRDACSRSTRLRGATSTSTAPAGTLAAKPCSTRSRARRPRLALCGHIHESWGQESTDRADPGDQPGAGGDAARGLADHSRSAPRGVALNLRPRPRSRPSRRCGH